MSVIVFFDCIQIVGQVEGRKLRVIYPLGVIARNYLFLDLGIPTCLS